MGSLLSTLSRCLWPSGTLNKIGVLWSAWSILSLARHAFSVGLGPTFLVMCLYYERAADIALEPVGTALQPVLRWAESTLSISLQLQPHWKHLLVLMGLYLFRSIAVVLARRDLAGALFRLLLAVPISVVASAIAGSIAESEHDRFATFLVAAIPVLGLLTYNLCNVLWDGVFMRSVPEKHYSKAALRHMYDFQNTVFSGGGISPRVYDPNRRRAVLLNLWDHFVPVITLYTIALALIAGAAAWLPISRIPSAGVTFLGVGILLIIALNLQRAATTTNLMRLPEESWFSVFRRTGSGQLGMSMLSAVLWTFVFLAGNAGLGLLGL